ncbi:hypothetical protein, variant [Sphaeroforma arctica JP610]|uniref:tRNA/rRNA methyltransferase SpoU type domain-containing protein n=1 Tax=Sphaeroforma arctica JP610 TaxID=667725 RepID=A0A0L0G4Q6_9EUKA|nr:hypothetical protein, variant [Sphaeroforma arctica JP610]KNC83889.1 hypothetical protein, variant [Sphaeroforma arctica JP610]|eukprot:XP_014157791.1 hypothetical protein, variant [Sphaeroforma arctica JP610]
MQPTLTIQLLAHTTGPLTVAMTRSSVRSAVAVLGRSALAFTELRGHPVGRSRYTSSSEVRPEADTSSSAWPGSSINQSDVSPDVKETDMVAYCKAVVCALLLLAVTHGKKGASDIALYYVTQMHEAGMVEWCGVDETLQTQLHGMLSREAPEARKRTEHALKQTHRLTEIDVLRDITFGFVFNRFYQLVDTIDESIPETAIEMYGCHDYAHPLALPSLPPAITATDTGTDTDTDADLATRVSDTNLSESTASPHYMTLQKATEPPATGPANATKNSDTPNIGVYAGESGRGSVDGADTTDMSNRQTKITPWETTLFSPHTDVQAFVSSDIWDTEDKSSIPTMDTNERSMVLCASLVCKAPNLGGLARTSEIFRMTEMVIASKALMAKSEFKNLAVAADQLLSINEVPVEHLYKYLEGMRLKDYTLIGLEQTAESVSLEEYVFPRKAVVLLGSEGFGIPPAYLHLLDVCIEIPQFGLTRSLNVHVSGALIMWEQAKQAFLTGSSHTGM